MIICFQVMQGYLESADLAGFDDDVEEESEWRLSRPLCIVLWACRRYADKSRRHAGKQRRRELKSGRHNADAGIKIPSNKVSSIQAMIAQENKAMWPYFKPEFTRSCLPKWNWVSHIRSLSILEIPISAGVTAFILAQLWTIEAICYSTIYIG